MMAQSFLYTDYNSHPDFRVLTCLKNSFSEIQNAMHFQNFIVCLIENRL